MKKVIVYDMLFLAIIAGSSFKSLPTHPPKSTLKLPGGFQVEVIADNLGTARHLAVTIMALYMSNLEN